MLNFLSVARVDHKAWTPLSHPSSIVLLAGEGAGEEKTAEILPGKMQKHKQIWYFESWCQGYMFVGGETFELEHNGESACAIPQADYVVLTGGWGHGFVTR